MSFLSGKTVDASSAVENDTLGGRKLLPTDVYDSTIKLAYITPSKSSKAVAITLVLEQEGKEVRGQFWYINAKGEHEVEKDGKKEPTYGYKQMESVCLLAAGQNFQTIESAAETRTIKLYNYDQKQEVNTDVQMLMGLVGKKIKAGIEERRENKTKKNDQTGKYEPIAEDRSFNVIDRFFSPKDGRTVAEILNKTTEPKFMSDWIKAKQGKVNDLYKEVTNQNGNEGVPGGAFAGGGSNTAASQPPADNPFM